MSKFTDEEESVRFREPIIPQKKVKMKVTFAERVEWKLKKDVTVAGIEYKQGTAFDACKLTLQIDDTSVRTEHADADPKLIIEDQFNIVGYPIISKDGESKMMNRQKLFQLETVFGFDPVFKVGGQFVEPYITKNGNKVAPKIEGVKRVINPSFFDAYFSTVGDPVMSNWENKTVYADIGLEFSEQYGNKNTILAYVKAPLI
jgi:hypothetical protein